jgi:hypothetical protein
MRQLAAEVWKETAGWDGKLVGTVRVLLCRPGELTRAAIEGRRARYISPVRLYLACSVLYFLVAAAAPFPDAGPTLDLGIGIGIGIGTEQTPGDAALSKSIRAGLDSLSAEERTILDAEIGEHSPVLRPLLRSFSADFAGLQRRMGELLPRALFLLIPLLAGVLAIFYRRRTYLEHLYMALHLQTFVFLVVTAATVVQYARAAALIGAATLLTMVVIVGHAIVAQRRVYGDSWPATVTKAVCVAGVYGMLWILASFVVAILASRA